DQLKEQHKFIDARYTEKSQYILKAENIFYADSASIEKYNNLQKMNREFMHIGKDEFCAFMD
ncbi:1779_t:CDS:1, partial [Entrophospora sp. SA101]